MLRAVAGAAAVLGVMAAPAHAALTVAGPLDPATQSPAFSADANGLQLAPCTPGTLNCGPPLPGAERFYYFAQSTMSMPNGGTALLILYVTEAPNVTNNPSVFNRVRIQLDGAPAGTYTITHPFGTDTVTVAAAGARGRTTTDIGCLVAASGPCNFASALGGRWGPFLTRAPGAPAPPAGFIGDGVTRTAVIGSPLGTNFFHVEGPGLPAGGVTSTQFSLIGTLFGGVVPAFASSGDLAFADQIVSTKSAIKTVTLSSAGVPGAGSNLTITGVALGGANAGDYAIANNTCTAAPMPSGATCTVDVAETPSATGARAATLTITDNTAAGTHVVNLTGNGIAAPAAPAPVVAPAAPVAQPAPLAPIALSRPKLAVEAMNLTSRVSLRSARRRGVSLVVFAPEGASVVRVRMVRGTRTVDDLMAKVSGDGVVTVNLPHSRQARRALHKGTYQVLVTPGRSATDLGATALGTISIR
jgi:hypothetical protein